MKARTIVEAVKQAIVEGHDEYWRACLPVDLALSFYQAAPGRDWARLADEDRMRAGVAAGPVAWAGVWK